jgi:hypothetical protein
MRQYLDLRGLQECGPTAVQTSLHGNEKVPGMQGSATAEKRNFGNGAGFAGETWFESDARGKLWRGRQ